MSSSKTTGRLAFWSTIALAIFVSLVFIPLIPLLGRELLPLLDVRRWSKSTWLLVNIGVLTILVVIRFGPNLKRRWQG